MIQSLDAENLISDGHSLDSVELRKTSTRHNSSMESSIQFISCCIIRKRSLRFTIEPLYDFIIPYYISLRWNSNCIWHRRLVSDADFPLSEPELIITLQGTCYLQLKVLTFTGRSEPEEHNAATSIDHNVN